MAGAGGALIALRPRLAKGRSRAGRDFGDLCIWRDSGRFMYGVLGICMVSCTVSLGGISVLCYYGDT